MKNTLNATVMTNIKFACCLTLTLVGLCLTLYDDSIVNNAIIGIGILLSGLLFMNAHRRQIL